MRLFLTHHFERKFYLAEESRAMQQKRWILRQYKTLAQNDSLIKFTTLVVFSLFVSVQPAFALSGITISADKITYDDATLHKANIALDLTGSDIAVVQAEALEYGKARLDKAHITIDLKANTTMLIKANHIFLNKIEAQNSTI